MPKKVTKKTTSKLPTVKELLEAGAHFGHETKRWNPKFEEFIYTKRGVFHIIDLEKTLAKLEEAMNFLQSVASKGDDIIFLGTKRQARDIVQEEAIRCGAHFVVNRWVGGLITNFDTVRKGIKRLREVEKMLSEDLDEFSQQELAVLRREWGRLERLFGGVKTLDKLPDAIVTIDACYERIAIKESKKGGVRIVALVDSNTDPAGIDYPVPGNDDAIKSVCLFAKYFADAVLAGNKGKGVKHDLRNFERVGVKEVVEDKKEEKEEKEEKKKKRLSKKKEPKELKTQKKKSSKKKVKSKRKIVKKAK